ncbi:hypothetical protein ACFX1T_008446 [Malus domestica]
MCKPKAEGGFRDLYAFNIVVLAKQGWRVFHQPMSLVVRVLKARFSPILPSGMRKLLDLLCIVGKVL